MQTEIDRSYNEKQQNQLLRWWQQQRQTDNTFTNAFKEFNDIKRKILEILTYNEVANIVCNSDSCIVSKFDTAIDIKQVSDKNKETVEMELLTHTL
ncbi:hypothetical protein [Candidatus Nitrosocosmicus franklandus]|uniref:hypothetical protein n=1 Tax=Candidatus Nitrosocosmicus franklandianus TaxID=1798806 RepID=UPI00106C8492|nr:hypothetical protein [Candidatus Nitrosocosmicus franklandus]